MGLRLTGLSNFFLFQNAMNNRNQDVSTLAEEMSSQKRINRPSDDPTGDQTVLGYQGDLSRMGQYQRNLTRANEFLGSSESALNGVKNLINRAKELAIQGNNGTLDTTARNQIATEVQQIQNQLLQFANTQVNGEYLFGGFKTQTTPFSIDTTQNPIDTYNGDNHQMTIDIGDGSPLQIQLNGQQVFMGDGTPATVDLFQTMNTLYNALISGNTNNASPTSIGAMMTALDKGLTQVTSALSTVGSLSNRATSTKTDLDDTNVTINSYISSIQDADVANVAFEYQKANLALDATIKSAGTVLNLPSLMQFINAQ